MNRNIFIQMSMRHRCLAEENSILQKFVHNKIFILFPYIVAIGYQSHNIASIRTIFQILLCPKQWHDRRNQCLARENLFYVFDNKIFILLFCVMVANGNKIQCFNLIIPMFQLTSNGKKMNLYAPLYYVCTSKKLIPLKVL